MSDEEPKAGVSGVSEKGVVTEKVKRKWRKGTKKRNRIGYRKKGKPKLPISGQPTQIDKVVQSESSSDEDLDESEAAEFFQTSSPTPSIPESKPEEVSSHPTQRGSETVRKFKKRKGLVGFGRKGAWKDRVLASKGKPEYRCCLDCWYQPSDEVYDSIVEGHLRGNFSDEDLTESSVTNEDGNFTSSSETDDPSSSANPGEIYSCSPPIVLDSDDERPSSVQEYFKHIPLEVNLLENLRANMVLLLPDVWTISISGGFLRFFIVSSSTNPSILKAVSYDCEGLKIFVHNKPLPSDNFIWREVMKDPQFTGHLSDSLRRVADLVWKAKVCEGVRRYSELWDEGSSAHKGTIESDFLENIMCFRSASCSLLIVDGEKCKACFTQSNVFASKLTRRKKMKDPQKINNRYMSKQNLIKKVTTAQEQIRKQQRKIIRLTFRVQQQIKKNSIPVGKNLADDLTRIISENEGKLTDVQQIFWKEQSKAFSMQGKRRALRWNPMMIRIALHLQMISQSAYSYLRSFIVLPSERTLYDYSHFVSAKEGVQEHVLEDLKRKVNSFEHDHQCYFNLQFDEMYIRSDLVMSRKTGEVVGYTNLNKVEEELADLEAELSSSFQSKKLAKKVLVYMVNGITNDFCHAVAVYSTDELSAAMLYRRTWSVVFNLECNGLKVLSLTCDGASTNKKFFRMHAPYDQLQTDFVYVTKNIACGEKDRPIFFIVDPPHIIKTVRNCLSNSHAHRKTRDLFKKNETLSWKVLEVLHDICLKSKYRNIKLTKAHVKLNSFSCMKVIYATQVFSKSVHDALISFRAEIEAKGYDVGQIAEFILLMNRFFDCLNGNADISGKRNKVNDDLLPYSSPGDPRLKFLEQDFLGFFRDWQNDVMKRPGRFSRDRREKMMVSRQSVESVKITVHSFVSIIKYLITQVGAPSIESRKFSQDKLEQYFGLLRMSGGASTNPDLGQVLQKSVALHAQGQAAAPKRRGNTSTQPSSSIIVDETPLPKKQRN